MWTIWWKLKLRFWRKHHLIKTGLSEWQWHDTQYRMLYGMMSLLMQFIKDEEPFKHIYWDSNEGHSKARDEFVAIQKWWLEYPHRLEDIEAALDAWYNERLKGCPSNKWLERIKEPPTPKTEKLSQEFNGMEEALEVETTDMLCRLIKIRGYLWT